ncbi:MAG TPA: hypothetical protein VK186_00925 [Candidatus Deferrimicrobium sp.]|nr:hypothetical protein [Candidatus Deferrimicrobium sp.]
MRKNKISILCIASLLFLAFTVNEPLVLETKDIYERPFNLNEYRGRVVVLYFTNKNYASQRTPKYSSQAASYAFNEKLQFVLIFSPKGIPKIGRGSFRKKVVARINQEERKFKEKVKQDGKDPAGINFSRYLTDWGLAIHKQFDINPNEAKFSIAILDQAGILKGHFPGEENYDNAVQLLETLLKSMK